MIHTTQGQMTPADLADHRELTDTHPHPTCPGHDDGRCLAVQDCPSSPAKGKPMGTYARFTMYRDQSATGRITRRQRRRLVKKAGRDPEYVIIRDTGMGYSPAMQGFREVSLLPTPVSGQPY